MLKNYASVINQYNGRVDSTEDYEAFRWHQIIKPLDLNTQDTPFDLKLGFAFIGFCCDLGVQRNKGRAGAKDGPAAIRGRFTNYACRFSKEVVLFDAGNIITEGIDLEEAQELLEKAVRKIRSLNLFPIVLGGGHETTFGHYMGQLSYLEDAKSDNTPVDLAILNFDAHFDNRPYDNGRSSGTMFRQIADLCEEKNLPFGYMPIGIQKHSNTVALFREADKRGTEYVLASEIHNDTVDVVSKKMDSFLAKHENFYITICTDVFSASFAPGVSAPQPLGLSVRKTITYIEQAARTGKLCGFDVCEIAPNYDAADITAAVGALLIFTVVNTLCEMNGLIQ